MFTKNETVVCVFWGSQAISIIQDTIITSLAIITVITIPRPWDIAIANWCSLYYQG